MKEYERCLNETCLERALAFYNQAIEEYAAFGEAYYKRALVFGFLEEYEKELEDLNHAIKIFENYLASEQANQEIMFNLGMAYYRNYKLSNYVDKAWYYLSEVQKINPKHAMSVFELANILKYEKRDYEEAINYYDRAIKIQSQNAEFYLERGECFDSLRRYEYALSDYGHGIALAPEKWQLYNRRGELYIKLNKWAEACNDYRCFRKFCPYDEMEPVLNLQKNPLGGPCIELYFAENTTKHKLGHPDSWYLEDCVFREFYSCFASSISNFSVYGDWEYTFRDMCQVKDELNTNLKALDEIQCFQEFFQHVEEAHFLPTLVRHFGDLEMHWKAWLVQLKNINKQLIFCIENALLCNCKMYFFGV
jgi:tetratricopeptide (TPR) repeat protein